MSVAVKSSGLSWSHRHRRPMTAGGTVGSGTSRQYSPVKSGTCSLPYLKYERKAHASNSTHATPHAMTKASESTR